MTKTLAKTPLVESAKTGSVMVASEAPIAKRPHKEELKFIP
ncbi:hypothetical protein [Shewanella fodinae]|nr:hypothetical protein [Shewanella fodinae]